MARNDIPNGWDKIRQNVQETERLMGQKQYNQSMIKAKQTVEYMVKLQCEQAGIMEGSMDSMIHELYNNGWISKSTAEHYLQIYDIGTKAAKNGDNGAYNANQAYHVLSQEIYSFADNGKAPRGRRPAGSRPQQSRNRSAGSRQSGSGMQPADLLKFVVPIVLVIILIVLIRVLTPKKPATEETSAPVITTETAETTAPETEPESNSPESVRNLIAAGLGIGFWPEKAWGGKPGHGVVLIPIRYPNCRRDLVVTVFEEAGNKPVVDEFVNYFCKYFEKDPSGMGDVTV